MARDAEYAVDASKPKRVYQLWQGNETFFCWGYLVAGPNWRACLGTAFLLLAPSGVFLGFVVPYVTMELNAAIMVFSILLPLLCALFLFLTACRDPGIIPRQEPDEEYLSGRKPRTQDVVVNGHRVVIRYNDTCHFYQPPRAHHCSVNDNCIERFDHHCPWVGTTIGKRNYRTFLLFIFTATVLCLYVIGVCLAQLFLKHNQLVDEAQAAGGPTAGLWGRTLRETIPALVVMLYTFIFSWFVGGLSGFHIYLVSTNQTTYENFRYNHDSRPNPFDRGIVRNCGEVWCLPIPKSQINFRAPVDPQKPLTRQGSDDLELAHQTAPHHAAPAAPLHAPVQEHAPVYHGMYGMAQVQTQSLAGHASEAADVGAHSALHAGYTGGQPPGAPLGPVVSGHMTAYNNDIYGSAGSQPGYGDGSGGAHGPVSPTAVHVVPSTRMAPARGVAGGSSSPLSSPGVAPQVPSAVWHNAAVLDAEEEPGSPALKVPAIPFA